MAAVGIKVIQTSLLNINFTNKSLMFFCETDMLSAFEFCHVRS